MWHWDGVDTDQVIEWYQTVSKFHRLSIEANDVQTNQSRSTVHSPLLLKMFITHNPQFNVRIQSADH